MVVIPIVCKWHLKTYQLRRDLWILTSFLGPLSSPECYPTGLFQANSWRGQSLLSLSPALWSCFFPAPSSHDLEYCYLLITVFFNLHIPNDLPSPLFVSMRSSRAPLLSDSFITCVRQLSSLHSRNLLDCLCPPGLSLQQALGCLKSPWRAEPIDVKMLLVQGLIHFFLVRWPKVETHCNVTCTNLFYPYP